MSECTVRFVAQQRITSSQGERRNWTDFPAALTIGKAQEAIAVNKAQWQRLIADAGAVTTARQAPQTIEYRVVRRTDTVLPNEEEEEEERKVEVTMTPGLAHAINDVLLDNAETTAFPYSACSREDGNLEIYSLDAARSWIVTISVTEEA